MGFSLGSMVPTVLAGAGGYLFGKKSGHGKSQSPAMTQQQLAEMHARFADAKFLTHLEIAKVNPDKALELLTAAAKIPGTWVRLNASSKEIYVQQDLQHFASRSDKDIEDLKAMMKKLGTEGNLAIIAPNAEAHAALQQILGAPAAAQTPVAGEPKANAAKAGAEQTPVFLKELMDSNPKIAAAPTRYKVRTGRPDRPLGEPAVEAKAPDADVPADPKSTDWENVVAKANTAPAATATPAATAPAPATDYEELASRLVGAAEERWKYAAQTKNSSADTPFWMVMKETEGQLKLKGAKDTQLNDPDISLTRSIASFHENIGLKNSMFSNPEYRKQLTNGLAQRLAALEAQHPGFVQTVQHNLQNATKIALGLEKLPTLDLNGKAPATNVKTLQGDVVRMSGINLGIKDSAGTLGPSDLHLPATPGFNAPAPAFAPN